MVADYLLHSGERTHNLDELTRKYLNHENISITELIGKGKNQKSRWTRCRPRRCATTPPRTPTPPGG